MASNVFDLHEVVVERGTPRSLLITSPNLPQNPEMGNRREAWVPRSNVDDDSEVYEPGHKGTMLIAGWFAESKKWL